ncbi:hypothetical protein GGX14DRAFT_391891 [Mycena pura]|uniref:GCM domain-containing protein n=1 Tax=Mycena pura TaxID=153505 RepID=A0AAD6VNJ8_9AGAR|nr:hypothetical protein GGX14DRAFT_391891 [Mycena pura]
MAGIYSTNEAKDSASDSSKDSDGDSAGLDQGNRGSKSRPAAVYQGGVQHGGQTQRGRSMKEVLDGDEEWEDVDALSSRASGLQTWNPWTDGSSRAKERLDGVHTLRLCLGVMKCANRHCDIITRRIPGASLKFRQDGCSCGSQLVHHKCSIRMEYWVYRDGAHFRHSGYHHHERVPARHLTPRERARFETVIHEHPRMGPAQLLTGRPAVNGPGPSVANISPVLLNQHRIQYERRKILNPENKVKDRRFLPKLERFKAKHPEWTIGLHWEGKINIPEPRTSGERKMCCGIQRDLLQEFQFRFLDCVDWALSEDDLMSPINNHFLDRATCEEISKVVLRPEQLGNILYPAFVTREPPQNHPLIIIFHAAVPLLAQLLTSFSDDHPVVNSYNRFFEYEDDEYRDSHVAEWLQLALDEPTPELIELMRCPLNRLQDFRLVPIPGVERRLRATGVGQAMLQILAVQYELEEPLNLNGDTFEELLERAVKPAGERANEYMEAMRAMVLSTKPKVLAQKKHWDIDLFPDLIKKFWAEHASFSPSFRPPTYRRVDDRQSRRPVLLVQVPKAAEENPDGFEEEMRGRTRRRQNDDSEDEDTPPPKRQATTRKLRPRGLKAAVQTQEPLGTVVAKGRGWVEIECPETTWGMAVVDTSAGGGDSACGGTLIVMRKNFCWPTAAARGDGDEGCGSDEEGRGDQREPSKELEPNLSRSKANHTSGGQREVGGGKAP